MVMVYDSVRHQLAYLHIHASSIDMLSLSDMHVIDTEFYIFVKYQQLADEHIVMYIANQ